MDQLNRGPVEWDTRLLRDQVKGTPVFGKSFDQVARIDQQWHNDLAYSFDFDEVDNMFLHTFGQPNCLFFVIFLMKI